MPPSVASQRWMGSLDPIGVSSWPGMSPSCFAAGQRCVVSLGFAAGQRCLPRASQAVPPGQRGRVLGDVEGVVSLPGLRCVASVVPTKLLDFTSHWIINECDPETIVDMTFL